MRSYHLTFDIDWAPDFCIEYILNKLKKQKIKSTFFITHETDIINEIRKDGHNLGIHPNFLKGSTQGNSELEIVSNLLNIVPEAKLIRTHSLYSYSFLIQKIFSEFPELKLDLTTFTYKFPFVKKFYHFFEDIRVEKINFNWEDDVAFFDKEFDWKEPKLFGDINIFNFHPIHICLNSINNNRYNDLKKENNNKIKFLTRDRLSYYKNNGIGTDTFFDNLINSEFEIIKLHDIQ